MDIDSKQMTEPENFFSRNKMSPGEDIESTGPDRPRLLFVSHSGDLYGAERSLLTLLRGLMHMGKYELMVFVPHKGALTQALEAENIAFSILPFTRWIGLRYHFIARYVRRFKNYFNLPKLIRAAELWNPDIIYTNTIATPVGAYMALKLTEKPLHIWHARELPGEKDLGFGLFDMGKRPSYRLIAQTADCLICNSEFLHDKLKSMIKSESGIAKKNNAFSEIQMKVVQNGFEIIQTRTADNLAENRGRSNRTSTRLLMAGGISPVKNYEEAIDGIKRLTDDGYTVTLDIYGSGSPAELKKLDKKISAAGLGQKVSLKGYSDAIEREMARADILLITSRIETFGRTAVEAMFSGCPVIGSDNGALPEIIKDGETGLLYRSGDIGNLVYQIKKMVDSPVLRSEIIKKASEYARRSFSSKRFTADIDHVLQQLLKSRDCKK